MRVICGQLSILFSVTDTQESKRTLISLPTPLVPLKHLPGCNHFSHLGMHGCMDTIVCAGWGGSKETKLKINSEARICPMAIEVNGLHCTTELLGQ